ncbi:hypothetical protein EVAR_18610_1 [Eumeta japonica]|uniref:Uncharacterized protein n=1 Tax=Eumeta variegata TaxID=151549 RepID=A0A4C1V3J6_EUMVA|nr:hypothetical protein EVAR_18610_1 [Eumeta japonica]
MSNNHVLRVTTKPRIVLTAGASGPQRRVCTHRSARAVPQGQRRGRQRRCEFKKNVCRHKVKKRAECVPAARSVWFRSCPSQYAELEGSSCARYHTWCATGHPEPSLHWRTFLPQRSSTSHAVCTFLLSNSVDYIGYSGRETAGTALRRPSTYTELRLGVTYEKGVTLGNVTMSHRTRERPAECLASLSHSTMIGLPRAQH